MKSWKVKSHIFLAALALLAQVGQESLIHLLGFTAEVWSALEQLVVQAFHSWSEPRGLPGWLCLVPALPGSFDSSVGSRLPPICYDSNLAWPRWSTVQPFLQSTLMLPNHGDPHWQCFLAKFSPLSVWPSLPSHATLPCGCGHSPERQYIQQSLNW